MVISHSFVINHQPVTMFTPKFTPLQVLAFGFFLSCAVSTSKAQTTMEEYKFISKGIKSMAEFGLDIKSGYEFGDLRQWQSPVNGVVDGVRETAVVTLYRTATKEPAGLCMVLKRADTKFLRTICIPMPSSSKEVTTLAWQDFTLATPEWSEAEQTYCWHLAMVLAQAIEGKTMPKTESATHSDNPIDRQMQACLAKIDYDRDGSDLIAPDYDCLWTALEAWQKEVKTKQSELLTKLPVEDRVTMAKYFKTWDAGYEAIQAEMSLERFGGSMYDSVKLSAELDLVKARASMIEIYIGIAEETRY